MMNDKIKGLVTGVCTLMELGCIAALAGIGLKRNNDCYKAEMKLIDAELELIKSEVNNETKDYEIQKLKNQIKELQKNEG